MQTIRKEAAGEDKNKKIKEGEKMKEEKTEKEHLNSCHPHNILSKKT